MTFAQLEEAIQNPQFNDFDSDTERCLWLARVEGWEAAHDIVETLPEPAASWIHAMLHREEGDQWNAEYWYNRANQPVAQNQTYAQEWASIAKALLS